MNHSILKKTVSIIIAQTFLFTTCSFADLSSQFSGKSKSGISLTAGQNLAVGNIVSTPPTPTELSAFTPSLPESFTTGNSSVNVKRIFDDIDIVKASLGITDTDIEFTKELKDIKDAYTKNLSAIKELIDLGKINPKAKIRMAGEEFYMPEKNSGTKLELEDGLGSKERPMKIGIFAMASNPIHHAHIMTALDAIREHELDKMIIIVHGVDVRKLDDLEEFETRYQMTVDALAPFGDLFAVSRIGEDSTLDGEHNIHRLASLNEDVNMEMLYLVGSDHYKRTDDGIDNVLEITLEDGTKVKKDVIKKTTLEDGTKELTLKDGSKVIKKITLEDGTKATKEILDTVGKFEWFQGHLSSEIRERLQLTRETGIKIPTLPINYTEKTPILKDGKGRTRPLREYEIDLYEVKPQHKLSLLFIGRDLAELKRNQKVVGESKVEIKPIVPSLATSSTRIRKALLDSEHEGLRTVKNLTYLPLSILEKVIEKNIYGAEAIAEKILLHKVKIETTKTYSAAKRMLLQHFTDIANNTDLKTIFIEKLKLFTGLNVSNIEINSLDKLKIEFDKGFLIFRLSETEPIARIYIELTSDVTEIKNSLNASKEFFTNILVPTAVTDLAPAEPGISLTDEERKLQQAIQLYA